MMNMITENNIQRNISGGAMKTAVSNVEIERVEKLTKLMNKKTDVYYRIPLSHINMTNMK